MAHTKLVYYRIRAIPQEPLPALPAARQHAAPDSI